MYELLKVKKKKVDICDVKGKKGIGLLSFKRHYASRCEASQCND
jgi:hypothetical protein